MFKLVNLKRSAFALLVAVSCTMGFSSQSKADTDGIIGLHAINAMYIPSVKFCTELKPLNCCVEKVPPVSMTVN